MSSKTFMKAFCLDLGQIGSNILKGSSATRQYQNQNAVLLHCWPTDDCTRLFLCSIYLHSKV